MHALALHAHALNCTRKIQVLVVDRNSYYGGESASLNLTNLHKKIRGAEPSPAFFAGLGGAKDRDFNIDLVPKFIMAHGNLIKILLHTKVTRYLDFKSIDGSFVVKSGKINKVPATPKEALASSLMGMFEKRRFRNFLIYMNAYEPGNPSTHGGYNLNVMTAQELYTAYGLDAYTQEFIGHTMALFTDDAYLRKPALGLIEALQLYSLSLQSYGNSPYIYPCYGLGGLPESFSRLAAIHGGTFMLNRSVDEVLFDADGCAWGIRGGDEVAKATMFIGDPSYFPKSKTRMTGKVIRSICVLDHLPAGLGDAMSAQIIIPGPQVGKASDIYVMCLTKQLEVCPGNVVVVIVSTKVDNPAAADPMAEIGPGLALLGTIKERFDTVSDTFAPVGSGEEDRCFISKSYDESSHFQSAAEDVLNLYERVTGGPLDLSIEPKIPQPGDY